MLAQGAADPLASAPPCLPTNAATGLPSVHSCGICLALQSIHLARSVFRAQVHAPGVRRNSLECVPALGSGPAVEQCRVNVEWGSCSTTTSRTPEVTSGSVLSLDTTQVDRPPSGSCISPSTNGGTYSSGCSIKLEKVEPVPG